MSVMHPLIAHSQLPPEQEAIRAKCFHPTGTFVEFPKEEVEQSIPERFAKMVRKHGERLAVRTDNYAFTYDELNRLANRVARAILAESHDNQRPVALLLENDALMIAAILGVLKAGKIICAAGPPASRRASGLHRGRFPSGFDRHQ